MLRQSLFPRWYMSRLTTDGSKLAFFLQLQEEPKPAYLFKQPVKHPYLLMMRKILIGQLAEVSIPVYENCWIASQCIDLWPCDHWSEAQLWGCSVNSFFEKQKKKHPPLQRRRLEMQQPVFYRRHRVSITKHHKTSEHLLATAVTA